MLKQFGAKATKKDLEKYATSKNWDGKVFKNLEETKMEFTFQEMPSFLKKQFCEKENREPNKPITIEEFDKIEFLKESTNAKFVWFGHSVVLLRINNKTILIDPMFGGNAAPISPFAVKRFSENTLEIIDKLPEIDLVLITHDHYDHLDFDSIIKLKSKVKAFYVALGVKRHLTKWGIDENSITEFDWWQNEQFESIEITFTPTRHFSGRGLTDRAKSIWGGWALKTSNENLWFSGDGGYGSHFEEIGKRLGPFDFGFIECGQYNKLWHQIHMYPEESVDAAVHAQVKKVMAVHWAGFTLAQHTWTEPIEKFKEACKSKNLAHISPKLGKITSIADEQEGDFWWNENNQ